MPDSRYTKHEQKVSFVGSFLHAICIEKYQVCMRTYIAPQIQNILYICRLFSFWLFKSFRFNLQVFIILFGGCYCLEVNFMETGSARNHGNLITDFCLIVVYRICLMIGRGHEIIELAIYYLYYVAFYYLFADNIWFRTC